MHVFCSFAFVVLGFIYACGIDVLFKPVFMPLHGELLMDLMYLRGLREASHYKLISIEVNLIIAYISNIIIKTMCFSYYMSMTCS